jgi:hypothetical protein
MVDGARADGGLREIVMKRRPVVELAGATLGAAAALGWYVCDSKTATRVGRTVRSGGASKREGGDVGGCTQPHPGPTNRGRSDLGWQEETTKSSQPS